MVTIEGDCGNDTVGLLGLGAMGVPMAANLLRRRGRVEICGRGRQRYEELIEAGASWHDTPRSLAESCSVIVLMLPDLPDVEAVLAGADGIMAGIRMGLGAAGPAGLPGSDSPEGLRAAGPAGLPGSDRPEGLRAAGPAGLPGSDRPEDLVLVISSTSSPVGVRELGERLAAQTAGAVRVVDAPVSGGVEGAADATLSIMVGGDGPDVARVLPVLDACGTPVHLGPLGAGQVAKACNQLIVAATITALGEAAVLADRSGLDLDALFGLLAGGYAASRMLETRGERIVGENYDPAGKAKYLLKDLGFAASVAESTDTRTVLVPALQQAFGELVDSGLGDCDMSVTRRFIAERR